MLLGCASPRHGAALRGASLSAPGADVFKPYTFDVEITRTISAQLGEIMLPENRSSPDTRMIPVRFVRLPTRAKQPAAPIVYLAGGPGGAGTDAMRGQRWLLFDRLRDVGDVIILDQRGTGLSTSVPRCDSSVQIPPDRPTTRDLYVSVHRAALEECLEFWNREGIDIRGYTTWESAADIDAVREALGAERVNLLGISYGTHLALAVLKRYPQRIDRLVLASAEGLDQTVKLPSHTEAYFKRLQAAIDADPASRELYPDARGLIERVLDYVEANPSMLLADDDPEFYHTLGRFEVQLMVGSMLTDPGRVASLLEGCSDAANGEFTWFKNYLDWIVGDNSLSFDGMPEAMDIASGISAERLDRVEAEAETALLGDALNFPMPHLRDTIPGIHLGEDFRRPFKSDRPALFFSGTLDGRTYPEAHAEIVQQFSNGATVTIENAGYNLFFSHPDVVEFIAEFFAGAPGRDCVLTAAAPSFVPD